jgi:hypothetical protein
MGLGRALTYLLNIRMTMNFIVRGAWDSKRAALEAFTDLKKAINMGSSFQNSGVIWRVGFSMWYTTAVSKVGGWLGLGSLRVQFWGPCIFSSMSMTLSQRCLACTC